MSRLIPLVLVAGCSAGVDLSDQGSACVLPPDAGTYYDWYGTTDSGVELGAGPSEIEVTLDSCYSSSVRGEYASCEATTDGTTITVTSEGGYTPPVGGQNDDCNRLTARCPGPDLTDGEWTLEYGGRSVTFEVPGPGPACVGP